MVERNYWGGPDSSSTAEHCVNSIPGMFFSSWSFSIDRVGSVNLMAKMVPWGDKGLINLSKVQIEDNEKNALGRCCHLRIQ